MSRVMPLSRRSETSEFSAGGGASCDSIVSDTVVTSNSKLPAVVRILRMIIEYFLMPWELQVRGLRLFRSTKAIKEEIIRQRTTNPFCIHPFSRFRAFWDFIMVLALVFTLLMLPVQIAFYSGNLAVLGWKTINLMMDCIFLMDIVFNFNTGFIHPSTEEVILNRMEIIKKYGKSWFIFDLASSIPIDYIYIEWSGSSDKAVLASTLKVLRLTKILSMIRVFRFIRLMRYVHKIQELLVNRKSKGSGNKVQPISMPYQGRMISTLNLIATACIFAHWNGCIQYFTSYLLGFPANSWVVLEKLHLENRTLSDRYTHSFYRAVSHMMSIGYGHKMPELNPEIWLTIISMVLGATFYAIFIGHISSFVMAMNYSGRRYEEKVTEVQEYMRYRKIPMEIQGRVGAYFEHRYQHRIFDEGAILCEPTMSYPLKMEILMHNCQGLIEKVPFLSESPKEFMAEIIMRLKQQVYFPGEYIITAGKKGDAIYFIDHGKARVLLPDGKVVKTLVDGMHFGEIALLYSERRVASVLAIEVCDLYFLTKSDFREVLDEYPEMREIMQATARKRLRSLCLNFDGEPIESYIGKVSSLELLEYTSDHPFDDVEVSSSESPPEPVLATNPLGLGVVRKEERVPSIMFAEPLIQTSDS